MKLYNDQSSHVEVRVELVMESLLEATKDFVMESGRGQDLLTQFQQSSMACLRM